MAYHEIKIIKGRKYHYLIENMRVGDKWHKVSVYLGAGPLSKGEIAGLRKKKSRIIEQKVRSFKKSIDPLYDLFSETQIQKLELVKSDYSHILSSMSKDAIRNYEEWFITEFTYDTNAIEGSTLSLQQTALILFDKIVPEGKSLREIYEAQNHLKAYEFVKNYSGDVTKKFICKTHQILMENILEKPGEIRDIPVYIRGAEFLPPPPEVVETELDGLLKWYRFNKRKYHPVVAASYFHTVFESIHPFIDGNGRTGRLILNFILMKSGYPSVNIKFNDRDKYIRTLKESRKGNFKAFADFVVAYMVKNRLISDRGHKY